MLSKAFFLLFSQSFASSGYLEPHPCNTPLELLCEDLAAVGANCIPLCISFQSLGKLIVAATVETSCCGSHTRHNLSRLSSNFEIRELCWDRLAPPASFSCWLMSHRAADSAKQNCSASLLWRIAAFLDRSGWRFLMSSATNASFSVALIAKAEASLPICKWLIIRHRYVRNEAKANEATRLQRSGVGIDCINNGMPGVGLSSLNSWLNDAMYIPSHLCTPHLK